MAEGRGGLSLLQSGRSVSLHQKFSDLEDENKTLKEYLDEKDKLVRDKMLSNISEQDEKFQHLQEEMQTLKEILFDKDKQLDVKVQEMKFLESSGSSFVQSENVIHLGGDSSTTINLYQNEDIQNPDSNQNLMLPVPPPTESKGQQLKSEQVKLLLTDSQARNAFEKDCRILLQSISDKVRNIEQATGSYHSMHDINEITANLKLISDQAGDIKSMAEENILLGAIASTKNNCLKCDKSFASEFKFCPMCGNPFGQEIADESPLPAVTSEPITRLFDPGDDVVATILCKDHNNEMAEISLEGMILNYDVLDMTKYEFGTHQTEEEKCLELQKLVEKSIHDDDEKYWILTPEDKNKMLIHEQHKRKKQGATTPGQMFGIRVSETDLRSAKEPAQVAYSFEQNLYPSVRKTMSIFLVKIGNYFVIKTLGEGAFGLVYQVRNAAKQRFAMKECKRLDYLALAHAVAEGETLKNLRHQHIIRYIDAFFHQSGKKPKLYYLVMECVDGGDLNDYIKNENPNGEVWDSLTVSYLFSQIVQGLEFLHGKRILHRDLKPANVLVKLLDRMLPRLKITDFGLSKELHNEKSYAQTKVGTKLYMSPEAQSDIAKYSFKSDIWAMACVLFEMCTSRRAFSKLDDIILLNVPTILSSISDSTNSASWLLLSKLCSEMFHPIANERPCCTSLSAKMESICTTLEVDENGRTCLHIAAMEGNMEKVERFMAQGGNPNRKDLDGRTCLHLCAMNGHYSMMRVLIEHGANVNQADNNGLTVLHSVVLAHRSFQNSFDVELAVALLIDHNASTHCKCQKGFTALSMIKSFTDAFCEKSKNDSVDFSTMYKGAIDLLEKQKKDDVPASSAEPNAWLIAKERELQQAKNDNNKLRVDMIEAEIALFKTSGTKDDGEHILHYASQNTVYKGVIDLLEKQKKDHDGKHILHYASQNGELEVIADAVLSKRKNLEEIKMYPPVHSNVAKKEIRMKKEQEAQRRRLVECLSYCGPTKASEQLLDVVEITCSVEFKDLGIEFTSEDLDVRNTSIDLFAQQGYRLSKINNNHVSCIEEFKQINSSLNESSTKEFSLKKVHSSDELSPRDIDILESGKCTFTIVDESGDDGLVILEVIVSMSYEHIEGSVMVRRTYYLRVPDARFQRDVLAGRDKSKEEKNFFLFFYSSSKAQDAVQELLNTVDSTKRTPLHEAAGEGQLIEFMVKNRSRDKVINFMRGRKDAVIEFMLKNGATRDQKDKTGKTALHYAASQGRASAVTSLFVKSSDAETPTAYANQMDNDHKTALHYAAINGHHDVIRPLHANGATLFLKDGEGHTPLHLAAKQGHVTVIGALVACGANPNEQVGQGTVALHLAVRHGNDAVIKALRYHKANITQIDNEGRTVLHLAAISGTITKRNIEFFVEAGVNPNRKDLDGRTVLHLAAQKRQCGMIGPLLMNGADVNAVDKDHRSALHLSTLAGGVDEVKLLLSYRADIDCEDSNEQSAFDMAQEKINDTASGQNDTGSSSTNADYQKILDILSIHREEQTRGDDGGYGTEGEGLDFSDEDSDWGDN